MCTVLFAMISLLFSVQPEWTWSVHPEAGFKVLTPSPLVHEVSAVPTDMDVIQFHQYHVGSVTDSTVALAFVIDHYILPSRDPESDDAYLRDFFENTIDELLTRVDGTLVYMDIINQPGQDVCIWKGNYEKGEGVIRGNIILSGDKYYGLQVFGLDKNKPDLLMSKFLDSFKLTPGTSP